MKVRPGRSAQQLQGWVQALAEIGATVNRGVSLHELLDLVAQTACRLMSYDFCAITMPDETSQALLIEGSFGLPEQYIRDVNTLPRIRLQGLHTPTPSAQAFSLGIPVQIPDIGSDLPLTPGKSAARDQGFTSVIAVPLNASGQTLGTLNCYTRTPHHFSKEEETHLMMLADQAAIAITTSRLRSEQARTISDLRELNETLEHQFELHRQAAAIHERLTALTFGEGGVNAVAIALADILGRPVVLSGIDGRVICSADYKGETFPAVLPDAPEELPPPPSIDNAAPPGNTQSRNLVREVFRVPVVDKDETVAWIWTTGRFDGLSSLHRRCIEQAATVLALELLRTRTASEAAWRDTNAILSGLLAGHLTTDQTAQAEQQGWDFELPHVLIIVRSRAAMSYSEAARFAQLASPTSPTPLLGAHDGYVVSVWPTSAAPARELRAIAEDLRGRLGERSSTAEGTFAVISGSLNHASDYPAAFGAARAAIRLASLRQRPPGVLTLAGDPLTDLVLQVPDATNINAYAGRMLGPLLTRENGMLLQTLSTLIATSLNETDASQQLGVDEATVNLRRERIEELLGRSLSVIADSTRISVALEIENASKPDDKTA
ncbi:helix-turn-helix domain-containing protein [Paenarthrobacter sp. NPDC058040]|uniref:helix-turn-helix domain-containing protein n=1 Tax=unclassified Paenarthrobacter TaxID=2634190 RepID=UPI0036D9E32C